MNCQYQFIGPWSFISSWEAGLKKLGSSTIPFSYQRPCISLLGCCNKLLRTYWLNTTHVCSLTVLEAESLRSASISQSLAVGRAVLPLELQGKLTSSSFWWLLTFLGLWEHNLDLCLCGHCHFFLCLSQIFPSTLI